jgi:hypothetical protein
MWSETTDLSGPNQKIGVDCTIATLSAVGHEFDAGSAFAFLLSSQLPI